MTSLPPISLRNETSSTFASPVRGQLPFSARHLDSLQATIDAHKFNRAKHQLHNQFELLTPKNQTPFSQRSRSLAAPLKLHETGSIKSDNMLGTVLTLDNNNFGSVASYHNLRQRKVRKE